MKNQTTIMVVFLVLIVAAIVIKLTSESDIEIFTGQSDEKIEKIKDDYNSIVSIIDTHYIEIKQVDHSIIKHDTVIIKLTRERHEEIKVIDIATADSNHAWITARFR